MKNAEETKHKTQKTRKLGKGEGLIKRKINRQIGQEEEEKKGIAFLVHDYF
jgi:hypothetical protein